MSPNRQKHNQVNAKARAIRDELSELNAQAWRDHLGEHHFRCFPVPIDDKEISSRLYGPQTKALQWERTSK